MNLSRNSNTLAFCLGGMWSIVVSVLISVAMSFLTGLAFKPNLVNSAALGTIAGVLFLHLPNRSLITLITILACFLLEFPKMETIWVSEETTQNSKNINLYDLFDRPNITFSQYVERHGSWEDR